MALEIIQQGEVRPLTQAKINGKLRRGLSLTRSIGFASIYNDVVFGFNANRIRHHLRARLVPHADPEMGVSDEFHADHRREAEEFLIGMLPLNGYLVALWLTDATVYHRTRRTRSVDGSPALRWPFVVPDAVESLSYRYQ